jgi:hypothetical protein
MSLLLSVLVAAQPISEVPEGIMNYPVYVLLVIEHNEDVSLKNDSTGRLKPQY